MKYTLTRIARQQKTSKAGKSYTSVGIQVKELGDVWINGFGNQGNANWKEGDVVEIEIKDEEYNGVTKKAFETPNPKAQQSELLAKMDKKLDRISLMVEKIGILIAKENDGYPKHDAEIDFDRA